MRIMDPHTHMIARVTDDYERMALSGIEAIVEPAFWLGEPRTSVATFVDYFKLMLGWETERAAGFGINKYTTIALNPKEANDESLRDGVMEIVPDFLGHERVVAVGEIGFDSITDAEELVMRRHLEMGTEHSLPIMIHLPHQYKKKGCERTIALVRDMDYPPEKVLIDHSTEETTAMILDGGYWAGHTVYPVTKLSPERAANIVAQYGVERMMINSSADWGKSDPLSVPKTVAELKRRGTARNLIQQLVWNNPITFFGQSGRVTEELVAV